MKNFNYPILLLFVLLLCNGCTTNDTDEISPNVENVTTDNTIDSNDYSDDVFVDGINQTYLEETGMTKEELLRSIAEDDKNYEQELESRLSQEALSNGLTKSTAAKGFDFNRAELAGAIGYMLYEIQTDPAKYFQTDFPNDLPDFNLGLNTELIRLAVSKFPALKDHTNKRKIDLYGFSLHNVSISGQTIKFDVRGNARYRKYVKIFGKWRKILDKRGSANVDIPLYFNTSTHTIEVSTIKISKISIGGGILSIISPIKTLIIKLLINKFVKIKVDVDLDFSYDFISKVYVNHKGIRQQTINGRRFVFFDFEIKTSQLIDDVEALLQSFGIICC